MDLSNNRLAGLASLSMKMVKRNEDEVRRKGSISL